MDLDQGLKMRRAIVGFLCLLILGQVARTMADDLLPADPAPVSESPSAAPEVAPPPTESPIATDSPAPAPSATPENSPAPIDTASPVSETPAPANSASPSASPTPTPPFAIANQAMSIVVPNVIKVDPRATSVYLPSIYASGASNLLVCAFGNQVAFDIGGQNQTDSKKGTMVVGDRTPTLRTSGVGSSPIGNINSGNGMRLISLNQGLVGKYVTLTFVALSEPSINPALCGAGSVSNTRTISIQGLGLNLDMAKGDVRLKK